MRAYRTALTHFSQRYPKVPVLPESFSRRTFIAFDMMCVNLADLEHAPLVVNAVKELFAEKAELTGEDQDDEGGGVDMD